MRSGRSSCFSGKPHLTRRGCGNALCSLKRREGEPSTCLLPQPCHHAVLNTQLSSPALVFNCPQCHLAHPQLDTWGNKGLIPGPSVTTVHRATTGATGKPELRSSPLAGALTKKISVTAKAPGPHGESCWLWTLPAGWSPHPECDLRSNTPAYLNRASLTPRLPSAILQSRGPAAFQPGSTLALQRPAFKIRGAVRP